MKLALRLLLALSVSCSFFAQAARIEPVVRLHKGTIFYDGEITEKGVTEFISLYERQKVKPTTITVRSKGGLTDAGMDFGDFIRMRKISLRVMDYCASSCANYLFSAARTKQLSKDAIVAWHGSANSMVFTITPIGGKPRSSYRCQTQETCMAEVVRQAMAEQPCTKKESCDEERAQKEAEVLKVLQDNAKRENAFFDAVGVDKKIAVYGQEVVRCNCIWTFSVDDMSHFGINDVVVEDGKGWHDFSWDAAMTHSAIKRLPVVVLALPK